jgi:tetratricopeptide (TPR) repeat protein
MDIHARHATLMIVMGNASINLKAIVAASIAFVMFSVATHAQEADLNDESELLEALVLADPTEAKRLERQLQALWSKSGSASADLLLKRGREAMDAEDYRAAIEHFTALTDHAPEFAEGWHMRASAFYNAELFGPAIADLERTLTLNPNNYTAMLGLGHVLEQINQPELAYDAYVRAQSIHPHHEDVSKAVSRLATQVQGKSI